MKSVRLFLLTLCTFYISANSHAGSDAHSTCPQWAEVEIPFHISLDSETPYLESVGHVEFTHESGERLIRPLFWDGDDVFKVRFASTEDRGNWNWELKLESSLSAKGAMNGTLRSIPAAGNSVFDKHGFWHIAKHSRQIEYSDGRFVVMVADTAWALPWRATLEEAEVYAKNRQKEGFNATLLMTIQPDKKAVGPRDRLHEQGFAVAFEDLPTGHINDLNPEYFQYLDQLVKILREHEIVPVFQPVFHGYRLERIGYGWQWFGRERIRSFL